MTKPLTVKSGQAQMSFQSNAYPDADVGSNDDERVSRRRRGPRRGQVPNALCRFETCGTVQDMRCESRCAGERRKPGRDTQEEDET